MKSRESNWLLIQAHAHRDRMTFSRQASLRKNLDALERGPKQRVGMQYSMSQSLESSTKSNRRSLTTKWTKVTVRRGHTNAARSPSMLVQGPITAVHPNIK